MEKPYAGEVYGFLIIRRMSKRTYKMFPPSISYLNFIPFSGDFSLPLVTLQFVLL